MAIRAAKCLKIETAGLFIGWIYLIAFSIGFVAALVSSIVGMKIYIAGEDSIIFSNYLVAVLCQSNDIRLF